MLKFSKLMSRKKNFAHGKSVSKNLKNRNNFLKFFSNFFNKSIFIKMILLFIIPIIFIVILGLSSYTNSRKALEDTGNKLVNNSVESMGKYFDLLLNDIEAVMFQITQTPELVYAISVEDDPVYRDELRLRDAKISAAETIRSFQLKNEYIDYIAVLGLNGNKFVPSRHNDIEYDNIKDSELFHFLMKNNTKITWRKELDFGKVVFPQEDSFYAVKIMKSNFGVTIGVVILKIDASAVSNALIGIDIGAESQVQLI